MNKSIYDMPKTVTEYRNNPVKMAELGAIRALEMAGLSKPYLKLREAKRLYGPGTVDRWIAEGLIHPIKDGENTSSVRIRRIEIEAVAKSSNRVSYYRSKAEGQ